MYLTKTSFHARSKVIEYQPFPPNEPKLQRAEVCVTAVLGPHLRLRPGRLWHDQPQQGTSAEQPIGQRTSGDIDALVTSSVLVTTSKALVTRSDALVTSSF